MLERQVITIYREGKFTLEQARQLLPIVRRITQEYSQKVEKLLSLLQTLNTNGVDSEHVEAEINQMIKSWHDKIKKLGANSKGLWLVDFDSGDGYFCWKFPETDIHFWHSYNDGFSNRKTIKEWTEKK